MPTLLDILGYRVVDPLSKWAGKSVKNIILGAPDAAGAHPRNLGTIVSGWGKSVFGSTGTLKDDWEAAANAGQSITTGGTHGILYKAGQFGLRLGLHGINAVSLGFSAGSRMSGGTIKNPWDFLRGAGTGLKVFTSEFLMGGKPLYYEIDNPTFKSWQRMGAARMHTKGTQKIYDEWKAGNTQGLKGVPPEKVVTFNEPLRRKIYTAVKAGAAISAMHAVAFHQDPSIAAVDFSDKSSRAQEDKVGYGATGDYALSSYYNR